MHEVTKKCIIFHSSHCKLKAIGIFRSTRGVSYFLFSQDGFWVDWRMELWGQKQSQAQDVLACGAGSKRRGASAGPEARPAGLDSAREAVASVGQLILFSDWSPWQVENQVKGVIGNLTCISLSPQNSTLTRMKGNTQFLIWSIQIELFGWLNEPSHTLTNINFAPMIAAFSWGNHKSLSVIIKEPPEISRKGNHKENQTHGNTCPR